MAASLILTGDINLMNVTDPSVPFARVRQDCAAATAVFGNLECCLYDPPGGHSFHNEGFFVAPGPGGEALRQAGFAAVGLANNVNYGDAAILASIARLDALDIPHTGAGADRAAGPVTPGIAILRAETAWQVPVHKTRPEIPPLNRPGLPPVVRTWAERDSLRTFTDDIAALRARADVVVASVHWGLGKEVLEYMRETAHAAVEAGADVVIGHGPHFSLPAELYRGKPIFYGLGSFSFHTGHGGRAHGDWVGMMARVTLDGGAGTGAAFRFVRHNAANETVPRGVEEEEATLAELGAVSAGFATVLRPAADGWVELVAG